MRGASNPLFIFAAVFILGIIILMTFQKHSIKATEPISHDYPKAVLADELEMGVAMLNVKNLEIMTQYYRDRVGLEELEKSEGEVILGYKNRPIITLKHTPDFPPPGMTSAGLYHSAIVFNSRGELARTIQRVLSKAPESYSGTADHLVSEAFYFTDPEGNGLELYFDKPRNTWQWENGQVKMGSVYIDPNQYIQQYQAETEEPEKKMGHIHLKVGDISQARKFYADVLGFAIVADRGTALFVSVGGYHHHLGMNVWESLGAGKRGDTTGLQFFAFSIPQADINRLKERLSTNAIPFEEKQNPKEISFEDPWGTRILVTPL